MRKRVWVFYRWMYTTLNKNWIYLVSSKVSFQLNVVQMKKDGHPYEILAEGIPTNEQAIEWIEKYEKLLKE